MNDIPVYEAGKYDLESFVIKDINGKTVSVNVNAANIDTTDITLLVYEWTLNESLYGGNIYGSVHVMDAVGLFYDFPLRGEELLTIEYKDFFGNGRTEELFVYAITDLKPMNHGMSTGLSYILHFTSIGKFISETRMIRKAYAGLISQSVNLVFEDYYKKGPNGTEGTKKQIEVEPTVGEQSLVVPYYSPEDTMHFFSRRAYGGSDFTSSYHFFETRDSYMFATYEYLVKKYTDLDLLKLKKIPKYQWNIMADDTPEGQLTKMNSIIDFSIMKPFDTMEDMIAGAYNKQVLEVDTISKTSYKTDYNYFDSFPSYNSKLVMTPEQKISPNNTKDFVTKYMTEGKRFVTIKDYPGATEQNYPALRPKAYYPEIISPSWTVAQHHKKNSLAITIYGRNDIVPGMLIDVVVDQFRFKQQQEDTKYSGRYIIESVSSNFTGNEYKQTLLLHRGGVGS